MTLEELYRSIGGNYDSAKRILQSDRLIGKFIVRFLEDTSAQRLQEAYEKGDKTGIFEGAHALKGVCANLGLDQLSRSASEIAEEFRPGNRQTLSQGELNSRMETIARQYQTTVDGIRAFAEEN